MDVGKMARAGIARNFCDRFPITLLLKGSRTIVCERGKPISYNTTGNPGMASGGMGDVAGDSPLADPPDPAAAARDAVAPAGRDRLPVIGGPAAASAAAAIRRRRILVRSRLDLWLDAAILVGFTFAYSFGFTGLAVHEWLGLALGLVLLVHLTLQWDWVIRTTKRLLGRRGHYRVIWLVNLTLLLAMTLCVASGILISRVALPELGIITFGSRFWSRLHGITAEVTLGLVPVHVALRWKWIVSVGRHLVTRTRSPVRRSR